MDPALDNAFLSPEFAIAVDRSTADARIAVVRDGKEVIAFLPFQRGRLGIGRAIALGVSDAQAVICAPDCELDVVELFRSFGLGVWEFDHLVSRLSEFEAFMWGTGASTVMDVREGYDAYLRQGDRASRRRIQGLPQKRRGLERDFGSLEFTFDSHDRRALDTLIEWKSAQYVRTGIFDRFSRRWIRSLVFALSTSAQTGCRGTLSTMSAGGRLVASHFGIRTETRLSLWWIAYNEEFRKYSPGLQLFLAMAEAAPHHGTGLLDLGKGGEQYKDSLGSWTYPVASGRVQVHVLPSLARRAQGGSRRRWEDFVVRHPRMRSGLPAALATIDRVP
jgi:CelD/BcsL family acetyltransferase involved in cellulose biosynthesis